MHGGKVIWVVSTSRKVCPYRVVSRTQSNIYGGDFSPLTIFGKKLSWTFDCPTGNNMLKVKNRNTRTRCEICSKLTIKTFGVRINKLSANNTSDTDLISEILLSCEAAGNLCSSKCTLTSLKKYHNTITS